jgi:hypothetical protein
MASLPLHPIITSLHHVTTHFLYIKYIAESTYFFSCFDEQAYAYQPCNLTIHTNAIQIDATFFLHPRIIVCIRRIIATASLKPLLALLHTTHKHYFAVDQQFLRELFSLIFIIYKQIIFNECAEQTVVLKKTTLETIIEISDKINQLPIAEILNAIDMLINELPPFLEKYEFHTKLTWKEWMSKYWWVPPVFGGWFVLKILFSLQRHQFYYSPYMSPRPSLTLPPVTDPVLLEIAPQDNTLLPIHR